MPERDYPIGHPAASDYKGEKYSAPFSRTAHDFPEGHPARDGANSSALDTPDGMRAAHNQRTADLHELAAVGSLPPVKDDKTGEALKLTPDQLAHIYRVRQALRGPVAAEVTARYGLVDQAKVCVCGLPQEAHTKETTDHGFRAWKPEDAPQLMSEKDQALGFLRGLGYSPEHAEQIFSKYGVPEVMKDREAALAR